MDELISQFRNIRREFIETLDRFPSGKRGEVLFGDWNLQDVVAHITGWDQYFVDILISLQSSEEPPYWKNMTDFNAASVDKRRAKTWDAVYDEFVSASEEFIRRYAALPEELRNVRFWKRRSYTPVRMLEINMHHYGKSHLSRIKKKLDSLDTS